MLQRTFRIVFAAIVGALTGGLPIWSQALIGPYMDTAFSAMTDATGTTASFATFEGWLEIANGWLPLSEWFWGLSAFLTFFGSWMVFKFTWKLIPTTG